MAPRYQLEVARGYLALGRWDQARTEARILRERWSKDDLADEAQLLTGQAWALEKKDDEALRALQVLVERAPRPDVKARALEAQAQIHASAGRWDRALELYALALPTHPNPDAIHTNIEAVRERREKAKTSKPGDRAAAFDQGKVKLSPREAP
jgi:tetratricopeptide (TPR) repeat protein